MLVPVKDFTHAKGRLTGHLDAGQRRRLARGMATRVLAAAGRLRTYVACDSDEVADWAESHGATVLWGPGLGLNGAIDHGVATVSGKGHDHVVILHGDLPLAADLRSLVWPGEIVVVPDQRADGTNLISRPTSCEVPAEYGGGSFGRHLAQALGCGVPVTVRHDARFSLDVDTIDHCRDPRIAPVIAALLADG